MAETSPRTPGLEERLTPEERHIDGLEREIAGLHREIRALASKRDALVEAAYREGWSTGYHADNVDQMFFPPSEDRAWQKSKTRRALNPEGADR